MALELKTSSEQTGAILRFYNLQKSHLSLIRKALTGDIVLPAGTGGAGHALITDEP